MTDNSLGDGVYYAIDDYAGLLRRITAMAIDTTVLLVFGVGFWLGLVVVYSRPGWEWDPSGVFFVAWFSFAWLYLVVLKRSKFRTIGYRFLGLKIVTTKGERPSIFIMTFRMLMWLFGPFNLWIDLCWLGADAEQQTLRDCYAGTYVVRSDAEPLGSAPLHLAYYCANGLALVYPRVVRPAAPATLLT